MITIKEAIEIRLKHNQEYFFQATEENTPDIGEMESYLLDNCETLSNDELQVLFFMVAQSKLHSKAMDSISAYNKIGYGE